MDSSSKWQIQSARLTTFFLGGETPDPSGFWSEVVGNDPSEEHKRASSGQFQQIGAFDGWQLRLLALPGRLDWTIAMEPRSQETSGVLSVIFGGPFDSALSALEKLANKWVEICPQTNRVALGMVLIQPVADRRSGYAQLSQYLTGVEIDPDNSTDFLYQINRPRDSGVLPNLKLNRLTKWSVLRTGTMLITMTSAGRNAAQSGLEGEKLGMRLDLDISTEANRKDELPNSKLAPIFNELVELGKEIASKGDVP